MSAPRRVLIVGAGAFGLSTAWHLLKTGRYEVTVLERAPAGLATDAASYDYNKIVRSDYADAGYARLASEAIREWRGEEWGGTYHESGVLVLGDRSATGVYSDAAYENCRQLGCRVEVLAGRADLLKYFGPSVPVGQIHASNNNVYINRDGGWAAATQAVALLARNVTALGGRIVYGAAVAGLAFGAEGVVDGVRLESGEVREAELVVLACGAWTPALVPELGAAERMLATGQSIATIQLTPEEAARYRDVPVILDFVTGWYIFPPNKDHLIKLAIHHAGYTRPSGPSHISTPLTAASGGPSGLAIPLSVAHELRAGLRRVYPELARKPFAWTRMCWYTDTPDSDWVVDWHPEWRNLLFATGGSGHAFKFLPTLGAFALGRIEHTLDAVMAEKFAWTKAPGKRDMSRLGQEAGVLRVEELVRREDLEGE